MIIFIYGPDSWQGQQKVAELKSKFIKDVTNKTTLKDLTYTTIKHKSSAERHKYITSLCNKWLKELKDQEIKENPLFFLISTSNYTDVYNKALSKLEILAKEEKGREESILFIQRLLNLYGRKLL